MTMPVVSPPPLPGSSDLLEEVDCMLDNVSVLHDLLSSFYGVLSTPNNMVEMKELNRVRDVVHVIGRCNSRLKQKQRRLVVAQASLSSLGLPLSVPLLEVPGDIVAPVEEKTPEVEDPIIDMTISVLEPVDPILLNEMMDG
jgi:hypothetical protein